MDEAEHAAVQVHVHDDAHMADVADVVPRTKKDKVTFPDIGEAFYRAAVPELHHGIMGQVVAEFSEYIACKT